MKRAAVALVVVAGVAVSTGGGAVTTGVRRCGNPPGVAGVVTSVDVWHGRFMPEDSPGWLSLCGGAR